MLLYNLITRLRLRFAGIKSKGFVFFKKHSSVRVEINQEFLFGVATTQGMSRCLQESILTLEENTKLTVDSAAIGRGSRIKLNPGAELKIGKNTYLADNCTLAISKSLTIGNDCAISWEVQFIDDDGHQLGGNEVKKTIVVGNHVWIGSRALILKGSEIGDGCVIAAGAVVSGKYPANCLIAGVPAKVIRESIDWK